MTLDDLERIAGALDKARASWEAAILSAVHEILDDAQAHAAKAVGSGRRSRDLTNAMHRIHGLHTFLAGPDGESLEGAIRDARAELYQEAFKLHREIFPPEYLAPGDEPTAENVNLVRAAAIHAYDPWHELEKPIKDSQRMLATAIAATASRADSRAIQLWRGRAADTITRTVRTLLNDSTEYADGEARRDLTAPEFRSDEPLV